MADKESVEVSKFKETSPHFSYRMLYALASFVVAQGAPLGYFFHAALWGGVSFHTWDSLFGWAREQQFTLIYLWGGASFFFTLFGYWCGTLSDRVRGKSRKLKRSLEEFSRLKASNDSFYQSLIEEIKVPNSNVLELFRALEKGVLGNLTKEQSDFCVSAERELIQIDQLVDRFMRFDSLCLQRPPLEGEFSFKTLLERDVIRLKGIFGVDSIHVHCAVDFNSGARQVLALTEALFELLKIEETNRCELQVLEGREKSQISCRLLIYSDHATWEWRSGPGRYIAALVEQVGGKIEHFSQEGQGDHKLSHQLKIVFRVDSLGEDSLLKSA